MANKRKMRESKEIWQEMEMITRKKDYLPAEKTVAIARLLVSCYREDLFVIIGCTTENEVNSQIYVDTEDGRVFICYTSEEKARTDVRKVKWSIVSAREMLKHAFAYKGIHAIVFNTDQESVLLPAKYLYMLLSDPNA